MGRRGGGSPCKPKSFNFLLLLNKNIIYWEIPHIGEKKVCLIAFRYVLTNILLATCIQLHNYDLFEKAQLKLSPLIQNRVQQDYLPESYVRHSPFLPNMSQNCYTRQVWIVPPSPKPLWETLGMRKNPTQ